MTEDDRDLVKHNNKTSWLNKVMLKQLQGKRLTPDDYCFLQNMMFSDDNRDYANYIKSSILAIDQKIDSEIDDPNDFIMHKQKNALLNIQMYKAQAQKKRDDAATAQMNVSTLNKYIKMAKERGVLFDPKEAGLDSVIVVEDDKTEEDESN